MTKKVTAEIFSSTNPLKILSFLVDNPDKEFLGSEIQKATSSSRAGVYFALKQLVDQGYALRTQKGRFHLYRAAYRDPVTKQFKILRNIILLETAVTKLQSISKKIILFGSASRGEDVSASDIDLLVISPDPESAKKIIASEKLERKIQPVIMTPLKWTEFKEKEKIFSEEVDGGIILWEERK
jgi:predicted nucleotidyltransferase